MAARLGNVVCMTVVVNGEEISIAAGISLQQLIEMRQLADQRIAVEINGEIVPRSAWPGQALYEHDRIEIVHAIGGG